MDAPDTVASKEAPHHVVIFTTPGCPYCRRAKQALQEQKSTYVEVDVSTDSEVRGKLRDITGQRTVPQARSELDYKEPSICMCFSAWLIIP
jgi:glutaredoxin